MTVQTKDFRAAVKAAGEADGLLEGQFDALVSVFNNEDSMGDVVMPGAFSEDIARWEAKGDPLPVIWSHDWADPFSHIGYVVKAEETAEGLRVTGQLDLDNPKAVQVYRLLKGRRVTQFSFAYDIEDAGWGKRGDADVYELRKLKTHEVGPCLLGVNQETELLAVKARGMASGAKAGRVLSQKNYDRLVEARDALSAVLEAATPDEPKASGSTDPENKTDEPSQADEPPLTDEAPAGKSEPAATSAPRRALAVARITTLAS